MGTKKKSKQWAGKSTDAATELAKGVCELSFGATLAPMRLAKQSRALQPHNGDAVNEGRGGEQEQTEDKSFTNKPVTRHSAGQV